MSYTWEVHAVLGSGMFVIGAVVGSFLNVCIYRMPLEKSLIWPDSRCPKCLGRIGSFQNIPILSWLVLGASCRTCKLPISVRYPLVEALTGLLFTAVYLLDAQYAFPKGNPGPYVYIAVLYHCVFVAVLIAISFIDLDWTIVPAPLTNFGIAWGLAFGAILPAIRPEPATALTHLGGLGVGVIGATSAAGMVLLFRVVGRVFFGREAMGAGDIHILALVGSVMGWQAAILTFFVSAFLGLLPALWKFFPYLIKRLGGRQWDPDEREIPLGPYLSMAAILLLLTWPWAWSRIFAPYHSMIVWLVRDLLG